MLPRVSVVLPFRDAASWLPQTLASLQRQRDVPFELVAVDDGSSDGSAGLVQRLWSDRSNPLRLLSADGRGVSAARNLGWRSAVAPFVAFLDADDLCLPGRLAGQAALLERRRELAHVMGGWRRIDTGGRVLAEVQPWREGAGFDAVGAFRHKAVLPSAWMLRREALERSGGFDPALRQAEDVDLLLRLALAGERGDWWCRAACGYRCHAGGASNQARDQARALQWVVARQLARLPPDPALATWRSEVVHATRAWAGWNAWRLGDSALAFELWRTALGLSPFPPALTWVHLAENVARSDLRHGLSRPISELLNDPLWQRLERHWWRRMAARNEREGAPADPAPTGDDPAGRLLLLGRRREGLAVWRRELVERLDGGPSGSAWHPQRLTAGLVADDALAPLRREGLQWCEALLAFDPRGACARAEADRLVERLAALLHRWALTFWPEDRRPAALRLEQSAALAPCPNSLHDLARIQRSQLPAGAAALDQLAAVGPTAPSRDSSTRVAPSAFWEHPEHRPDRCEGPACSPCANRWLEDWQRRPLAPGSILWIPPGQAAASAPAPLPVTELPGGTAWIRPPRAGVWGTTHAVAVADGLGRIQPELCRRYPIGWPGCPHPPSDPEPAPAGEPLELAGAVLAVADLSAELHYHWLLESLPRLGMALEALEPGQPRGTLRIWHNGGDRPVVREALLDTLGLEADQLIDARLHPWIRAQRLLVPAFPSPFGRPTSPVRDWLRSRLLPAAARSVGPRRLWLTRRQAARRPVWGEAACLEQLQPFGLTVVDPASLGLRQQAALLAGASLVVAPHGAALAGLVFAPAGAAVLELHHPDYAPPYFHTLAAAGGLRLARCSQGAAPPAPYRWLVYEGPIVEPIVLEPERIAAALSALESCRQEAG